MKIAVIHGSPRKGTTYQCVDIVKRKMSQMGEVIFTDIFLPQDAPCFCKGCFTCFRHGEDKCPNAGFIQPIASVLDDADGFIIATPVYVMQVTGGLKVLLDHLAYCYLNHRPRFFKQKVLIISTTAGAGVGNCIKYLKQNLSFWGVNKVLSYGIVTFSDGWEGIAPKKKEKMKVNLEKIGEKFFGEIATRRIHAPSFLNVLMFHFGKVLMKQTEEGHADREYWMKNGWVDRKRKFFIDAPIAFYKTILCQSLSAVMDKSMRSK